MAKIHPVRVKFVTGARPVGGLLPFYIPLTRSAPSFTRCSHEYDDMYMIVAKSTQ